MSGHQRIHIPQAVLSSTQVILLAVRFLSNRDARKEKAVQGVLKTEDQGETTSCDCLF